MVYRTTILGKAADELSKRLTDDEVCLDRSLVSGGLGVALGAGAALVMAVELAPLAAGAGAAALLFSVLDN